MTQVQQQNTQTWSTWLTRNNPRQGSWMRSMLGRNYTRLDDSDLEGQNQHIGRNGPHQVQQELFVRQGPAETQSQGQNSMQTEGTNAVAGTQGTYRELSGVPQPQEDTQVVVQSDQLSSLQQEHKKQSLGEKKQEMCDEGQDARGMQSTRFGNKSLEAQQGGTQNPSSSKEAQLSSQTKQISDSQKSFTAQCLICFEPLTSDDFKNNRAISLQCTCRGDVAYRHRECAEKWAKIKGNNICDVCKTPIKNIDAPPPDENSQQHMQEDLGQNIENFRNDQLRSIEQTWITDFNWFDCVRVAWIVMIVCMVSFDFTLQRAVAAGILSGLFYIAIRYCLMVVYVRQEQWALFNAINHYVSSIQSQRTSASSEPTSNAVDNNNSNNSNSSSTGRNTQARSPSGTPDQSSRHEGQANIGRRQNHQHPQEEQV